MTFFKGKNNNVGKNNYKINSASFNQNIHNIL